MPRPKNFPILLVNGGKYRTSFTEESELLITASGIPNSSISIALIAPESAVAINRVLIDVSRSEIVQEPWISNGDGAFFSTEGKGMVVSNKMTGGGVHVTSAKIKQSIVTMKNCLKIDLFIWNSK